MRRVLILRYEIETPCECDLWPLKESGETLLDLGADAIRAFGGRVEIKRGTVLMKEVKE